MGARAGKWGTMPMGALCISVCHFRFPRCDFCLPCLRHSYTAYVWDDELLNISVPTALTSGDPADLLQLVNVLLPLLNSTSGGNASASGGIDLAGLLAVLNTIPSTSMPVYEALEALGAPIGQVSVLHNASTKHALPSSITDHIRRLLFDRRRERGTVGDSDSMEKDAYFHIRSEALPLTVYEDLSLQLFLNLFVALFLLVCYDLIRY